jgi:hypothetical protein
MVIYLSKAFWNMHTITSPSNPSVNGNTNGYEFSLDLFLFLSLFQKYSNRDAHENNNSFYETQAN